MVALMAAACVKDGPVLNRAKATLYIVDSKSGEVQLKPKSAKLSFNKVSALYYDISLSYTFKPAGESEKTFSLKLKDVPFFMENELYVINAEGIEGSGKVGSESFVFSEATVSGEVGTAAQTWISIEGETHGERIKIDIEKVSESSRDVPVYDGSVCVDYLNFFSVKFTNDSEMKCDLVLSFNTGTQKTTLYEGSSGTLRMWADGDLWEACSDIEVDFSNGNHIAGSPRTILATSPEQDTPIKMTSEEQDWFLFAYLEGYIGQWKYPKYTFSIQKP